VAQAGLLDNVEPMIPPSVTKTIEPVAEIIWQMTRTSRLAFFMRIAAAVLEGRILTYPQRYFAQFDQQV
jgi:hypothetical protein